MNNDFTRKDIENTAFSKIINIDTGKTRIALGNQLIIEREFDNEELADEYVKGVSEIPWELILNASACFTEFILKERKDINNQN